MKIVSPFQSPYFANTYIIGDEGEPCLVVDPGNNENGCLDRYVERHHRGVVLGYLLTHGHYDHIYGLYSTIHKSPIYIHSEDVEYLANDKLNLLTNLKIEGFEVNQLEDNEIIDLGGYAIKVIHTPFHTPGSSCFHLENENILFSGDTLFHLSVGRSDLPGGNIKKMEQSLNKLKKLPDETKVYPGHESITDIKTEKRLNPYLNR